MIHVDQTLLQAARRWTNGANVHRIKEMIFAYEIAVELHNRNTEGHETYQKHCELTLRRHVFECQMNELDRRSEAAIRYARELLERSTRLQFKSEELARRARSAHKK
jgi:hypothetical protein